MNPIDEKVCVLVISFLLVVITTELVTFVNTVDLVGSGRKSWSSMVLFAEVLPRPTATIAQSVTTPHPVKFVVGMMYCLMAEKPRLAVLFRGGKEGT